MLLLNPRAVTKVAMPGQPATNGSSSNEPARRAGAMRPSLLAVDLLRSLLARISLGSRSGARNVVPGESVFATPSSKARCEPLMEPRLPSQAIDSLDPESGDDRGNEEEEREERDDGQADSQADDHADGQVEAARMPHLMDMVTDDGGEAARLPHLTDMVTEFVIAINGQENAVLCSGSVIDLQRKVSEATQAGPAAAARQLFGSLDLRCRLRTWRTALPTTKRTCKPSCSFESGAI